MTASWLSSRPGLRLAAGVLASAVLLGLYARGGVAWVLGFVALVPWLRALDNTRTLAGAVLAGWVMSVAFVAATFAWFGTAIGAYSQLGTVAGLAVVLVAAPLLQPQFIAFALVRHVASRHAGSLWLALAGPSAWVAAEWAFPKFLGDTLGYGLYPAPLLRQAAEVGGTAGLTLLLLLANEGVRSALVRRSDGARAVAVPLALAALVPLMLAGYGAWAVSARLAAASPGEKPLRMGLVQSNIVDYDRLRREKGAEAVVREILDTHFAMSYDAIERQQADAVLWSETVYPLTFGHPKNEEGAELDREIQGIVNAAQVPFVFGTYDVDDAGEYNAAAFVEPGKGVLGYYRKTRLFPFTEYVPAWLDGPRLRAMLPWTGAWQAGNGARVFPLNLRDGREVPVLPMICLDDVDTSLAIEGARQGARAILTMSNDSWFTQAPLGAEMHQTAAAFRSIETRLPQFRVTSNGYSAVIDAAGNVVAGTKMGERTLVIGELPVAEPPMTLMVAWGDWVGRAAALLLALAAAIGLLRRWWPAGSNVQAADARALPAQVAVVPPAARWLAGVLRAFARGSLLWMVAAFLMADGSLPTNTIAQIRLFSLLFLAPEIAAWLVMRAYAARAALEGDALVLSRGGQRIELRLREIAAVRAWRLPIPAAGALVELASGERYEVAHGDPAALARVLSSRGATAVALDASARSNLYAQARAVGPRGLLDHPVAKFALLPLALAIPAFRLHQIVNYGSSFGEYQAYGLWAYLSAFGLWWAAWVFGVVLTAAAVRAAVEAGTLASALLRPGRAADVRLAMERLGLAVLYLGMPAWLLMRVYGG